MEEEEGQEAEAQEEEDEGEVQVDNRWVVSRIIWDYGSLSSNGN